MYVRANAQAFSPWKSHFLSYPQGPTKMLAYKSTFLLGTAKYCAVQDFLRVACLRMGGHEKGGLKAP